MKKENFGNTRIPISLFLNIKGTTQLLFKVTHQLNNNALLIKKRNILSFLSLKVFNSDLDFFCRRNAQVSLLEKLQVEIVIC